MHVRLAGRERLHRPPPSKERLSHVPALLAACEITGADAVIPVRLPVGECPLAKSSTINNLHFIGPKARTHPPDGRQDRGQETAKKLGIPVVPGSDGAVGPNDDAMAIAQAIGFPVW